MEAKKGKVLFRFKSIQTTISLSFLILTSLALIVFFLVSLNYTQKSILKNSTDYTEQLIKQVNRNMDYYIAYMENTADMITHSSDVKNYLFQEDAAGEVREAQYGRVISQFQTIMNSRQDIRNVAVVSKTGRSVINRGTSRLNPYVDLQEQSWYAEWYSATGRNKKGFELSSSHIQNAIAGKYEWVITLSSGLFNEDTRTMDGVFFIDLNYNTINDLCDSVSLGEKGYIYVVDQKGDIIYHPQQQLLYSGLKSELVDSVLNNDNSFVKGEGKEKKVYTMSTSPKTGWTVVGVSFMSELMKEQGSARLTYVLMTLLLLLVSMILASALSKAITRPIKSLDHSMKVTEDGKLATLPIQNFNQNEIGRLGQSFNRMTLEINDLIKQNIKEQKEKRKAEMRALQAQINPHFLYNTLDSIIWMAESGKHNDEVVLMTSSLSKLFRRSIGNDKELVTIAQELEYTETYLTIQRLRYRDKLEFDIQVSEEILEAQIVKLTLQPIVENAIYHGIKYISHKGLIQIRGAIAGNTIVLEVIDNGNGMSEEELNHIMEKRPGNEKNNGVGVYNVENRLQLYYGKNYGLHYESKKGEGTQVKITIPFRKREDNESG